jgi:hypothetical protein
MSQLGDKISGSGSDAGGRPISGKDVILKFADPTPKKVKHQSPQDAIDEFWKKFDTKTPGIGIAPTTSPPCSLHLLNCTLRSIHNPAKESPCEEGQRKDSQGSRQGEERGSVL